MTLQCLFFKAFVMIYIIACINYWWAVYQILMHAGGIDALATDDGNCAPDGGNNTAETRKMKAIDDSSTSDVCKEYAKVINKYLKSSD